MGPKVTLHGHQTSPLSKQRRVPINIMREKSKNKSFNKKPILPLEKQCCSTLLTYYSDKVTNQYINRKTLILRNSEIFKTLPKIRHQQEYPAVTS